METSVSKYHFGVYLYVGAGGVGISQPRDGAWVPAGFAYKVREPTHAPCDLMIAERQTDSTRRLQLSACDHLYSMNV